MRWTPRHNEAVLLVAEDRLTNAQIAARLGMTRQALDAWKADPTFREKVTGVITQQREAAMTEAIAVKAERMRDYQELRRRLWNTIMAASETYAGKTTDAFGRDVPAGAAFGLMSRQIVPGSKGLLVEWAVDTVRKHTLEIYGRLSVDCRVSAVVAWMRL